MNAAIAQHLNVAESAIVRIEEWAHVLFVVCKKIGARFVSKKLIAANNMNIPQPVKTEYSTEWKDGEGLQTTVIVSKHDRANHYSAGYMHGCHIEWITNGYFQNLESAWSAAVSAQQAYLAKEQQSKAQRDYAFAASVGKMQTSTGEWVTADEWDEVEGSR